MIHVRRGVRGIARRASRGFPRLREALIELDLRKELWRHTLAEHFPGLIRPRVKQMTVAVTARCNLRCHGCRYGRDFMRGEQLSLEMVRQCLTDGRAAGAEVVRLYGGEPLLHRDLPAMVQHCVDIGLRSYVTTNGILLEKSIDELYQAGLRDLSFGFYGAGADYDGYVHKANAFDAFERGIRAARDRYGDELDLQLNYLIMRPTCNLETLYRAWELATEYGLAFHTDLIHYSLPYFIEGRDHALQLLPEDQPAVQELVDELLRLKEMHPERIRESLMSLRSIPDWLRKGPEMRVPCDAYRMIWVGADGSVKLCYVTFDLGNLHEQPLSEMLYGKVHRQAARDCFQLSCPNCYCERKTRIQKHAPSRRKYADGR